MSDSLESRMARLREEFGGLVDDATIRRMVLEDGGVKMATKKISELKDREEISAIVKVKKINEVRTFNKRTGGQGQVRNIEIEDDSGSCRLTLWDEDINLPEGLDMKVGTELKLSDCYVKQSDFGTDISKGKKGKIEKVY
jgi:ssDNA-binding replication factor A large subunit